MHCRRIFEEESRDRMKIKMKIATRHIVKEYLMTYYGNHKYVSVQNIDSLSKIIESVIRLQHLHTDVQRLDDAVFRDFINSNSLSVKILKKELGRNYKKIVDTFFVSSHYDKVKEITRAYKLRNDVLQQLIIFISNTKDKPAKWISENNRLINKIRYGIFTSDENNKKIKSTIKIDALVRINVDALDECINAILKIFETGKFTQSERVYLELKGIGVGIFERGGKELLLDNLWKLYTLKRLSLEHSALPQLYIESVNGRITGVGFNLQNTIGKEIRKIALSNQDMYDYDMEASTPTIFISLAYKYKVNVPSIETYLHNKSQIRKDLSNKYDISVADIKSAMNSLFYGVGTRVGGHTQFRTGLYAIFKSESSTKEFLNDDFIKNIIEERNVLCKKIVENAKVSRGKALYNVLGKGVSLYETNYGKKTKRKENSLVSHIVFGYEALIIQTTFDVLKKHNVKIHLLIYDGFVADEIKDLRKIEKMVIEELKVELPNLQLKYSKDRL